MHLFEPALLAIHATTVSPSATVCAQRLALLDNLRRRRDDGSLGALAETRVEQSFNERMFAELFDYRTLLRDGQAEYHLQPKEYSRATRQYDDFSLGFFGPGGVGRRCVSAELKGMSIDLDAPQASRGDKASPVAQAHQAVAGECGVGWVLVSNYDEMRLYRAGEPESFERVVLTELDTVEDFRRAYALFGRRSLLGAATDSESPLETLWRDKEKAMLKAQTGHARLIHEAAVTDERLAELRATPVPLHRLDDALRSIFEELRAGFEASRGIPWWPPRPAVYAMKLDAGKLRQVDDEAAVTTFVEASPAGSLRVWEYVGDQNNRTTAMLAHSVAQNMAAFVHFAGRTLHESCATSTIRFRWTLRDIDGAMLGCLADWCSGTGRQLQSTVDTSSSPWIDVNFNRKAADRTVAQLLSAVRELLFPFERRGFSGHVVRLAPPKASFEHVVLPSVAMALGLDSA